MRSRLDTQDCTEQRIAPAMIEVRGLSKFYEGGIEVLRDLNVTFPEGQLTVLLGPSGCGKTTLLKIIAGLLQPNNGEVLVEGTKCSGPGPERALVFQDFALLPWRNVLNNIAYGLELRHVPKRKRYTIAQRYIEEVGLTGFDKHYPHELSGGMRQRVGLARALAVNAKILLMDEPFTQVDEQTRRKLQEDLLSLLERERKTVILVTHSIEEAVYLSDRIVLLSTRPSSVTDIVDTGFSRGADPEDVRRSRCYLDTVEMIWQTIRQYLT